VATSSSQLPSTPSTPPIEGNSFRQVPHRTRTRGVPLRDDSAVLDPARKRVRTNGSGTDEAIDLLVSVLKGQQGGSSTMPPNKVELAILLVQREYETRLSEGHLLEAISFLTTKAQASVFINLNSRIRDMWLCKYAHVTLI
jgi:hypothetical protein